MFNTKAFSAAGATSPLAASTISRRDPGARDVRVDILFCGVCHSDLHYARNEWKDVMPTVYPCVPGHEIVGRVASVGSAVTKFKGGDLVGWGVSSTPAARALSARRGWEARRSRPPVPQGDNPSAWRRGLEQFCPNMTMTYGSTDVTLGGGTLGGYSASIVVNEGFVLRMPGNLDPAGAAPLLCAGITTYSPLRHWGVTKGKKVGVVGLGGLGHMGVKFSKALGAHTVVFTTSESKKADALRLGASEVILSTNASEMAKHAGSFDFILDTVSAIHDIAALLNQLKRDGNMTLVGAPERPLSVPAFALLFGRRSLSGSPIGGLKETQEIGVEVIPVQKVNEAYDRMLRSDVKYRFSIDMKTLA